MSKVGGALPSWYWPNGIPRRSAVPQQGYNQLLARHVTRQGKSPALVSKRGLTTFEALSERVAARGAAFFGLDPEGKTLAVAIREVGECLVCLLAGMAVGRRVLLVDPAMHGDRLARHIEQGGVTLVVTDREPSATLARSGVRVVTVESLPEPGPTSAKISAGRPLRTSDPAVLLPDPEAYLVVHSQSSLLAMGVGLTTFVPELRELAVAVPPPLWHWESLTAVLAALSGGRPILDGGLGDFTAEQMAASYVILLRDDADTLIRNPRSAGALSAAPYVFVSTGPFTSRWRRSLEDIYGGPVLTLWGVPRVGPLVAAHPSWSPLAAHGLPLANVRLVPIDPATGTASVIPWEMLERAEIAVESPAAMVGTLPPERAADVLRGNLVRTGAIASMDHVGVVTIHAAGREGTAA